MMLMLMMVLMMKLMMMLEVAWVQFRVCFVRRRRNLAVRPKLGYLQCQIGAHMRAHLR